MIDGSLEALIVAGAPGDAPARAAARQLVHRVVGLAGTIGFKSLSTRAAAGGPISAGPATIALVRVPAGPQQAAALEAFRFEARRRDVIGHYNDTHLVLLLPGMTAVAARDRLRDMLRSMTDNGHTGLAAGVAGAAGGAGATVEGPGRGGR